MLGASLLPWIGLQPLLPLILLGRRTSVEGLPPQCAARSLPLCPILHGWQSQIPGDNDSEGEEEALAWVRVLLVYGPG